MLYLWWFIAFILVSFSLGIYALILAIYLNTLNMELALTTFYLEMKCKLQPKLKTVTFLLMANIELKEILQEIVNKKDIDLFKELKKQPEFSEIKMTDIKQIKYRASGELEKAKKAELITFEEIEKVLKEAGLYSFLFSIKRTIYRYGSFEQGERYINSEEVSGTFNMLFGKYISTRSKRKSSDSMKYFTNNMGDLLDMKVKEFMSKVITI